MLIHLHYGIRALTYLTYLPSRPLERWFYRSDLSAAYHLISTASIYITLWLNAYILIRATGLRAHLCRLREHESCERIGRINRLLLDAYLGGFFLLPNLCGPIYVCWWLNPHNRQLDELAHLYGFWIGVWHVPLLLSLSLKLILPGVFGLLVWAVGKVSEGVWWAADILQEGPAALIQGSLRRLREFLLAAPRTICDGIDRKVLRSESKYLVFAVWLAMAGYCVILYAIFVETYRAYLQRAVARVLSSLLMDIGDHIFAAGYWLERLVVEKGFCGGTKRWQIVSWIE
ncbi:hypothetical protein CGCSCA1_v002669 [Colletotrichum siamense]|nr:hypothetical protein CGCSCA1_v002669 [Colletotrichum siamense]